MNENRSTDLVVVGSGAAGLMAALAAADDGLRVRVLERTGLLGGTSATSGGLFYLPGNSLAQEAGTAGTREQHLVYLRAIAKKPIDERLLNAFLDAAPAVAEALSDSGVELRLTGLVDYVRDAPEAAAGKVLATQPFDPGRLGDLAPLVRSSPYGGDDNDGWTGGRSLIGWLVGACAAAGVEFDLDWRVTGLVRDGGAVTGVIGHRNDDPSTIAAVHAPAGVVLGSGGYEYNRELIQRFVRAPLEASWSCRGNEGDGIVMAEAAGAELGGLGEVQWYPLVRWHGHDDDGQPMYRDAGPVRNLPGSIVVDGGGERFTNEGQQFTEFGRSLSQLADDRRPAWLVIDNDFVDRYGATAFGGASVEQWADHSTDTIDALAEALGVPSSALTATIERFNAAAMQGEDPDFGRGDTAFDREWGDPSRDGGATCLAPLTAGPFHAARVYVGCSGTTGGPVVDHQARVVDRDGEPIPGLFAAGNVTPAIFGDTSPGSGATLGPGMAFGYLAARSARRGADAGALT